MENVIVVASFGLVCATIGYLFGAGVALRRALVRFSTYADALVATGDLRPEIAEVLSLTIEEPS